jgi:4-hydroxybenzoate polyprenyltransferase
MGQSVAPSTAVNDAKPSALAATWRDVLFLVKSSRPGFWSTAVWFYMLTVGQQNVFSSWTFWLGLVYFTLPFGLLLYGWNDIGDTATDRLNPRKGNFLFGPIPADSQLARLPLSIALVQLPFLAAFVALEGARSLVWFVALLFANVCYNTPPLRFKNRPFLDMLNQAGYLLVFVTGSWLNDVPQLPWATFVFAALFAMHAHLFGQIMDLLPDGQSGRRTTAAVLGIRPAKILLILLLAVETAMMFTVYRSPVLGIVFSLGVVWFTLDLTLLWRSRPYSAAESKFFGLGLNLAAIASIPFMWWSGALTRLP